MVKESAHLLVQSTNVDNQSTDGKITWAREKVRPWNPGFWKQFPVSGFLAIFLAFSCGIVACVLALVSDGKPLDYWTIGGYNVQPSVLLAILATICNAFLAYAFARGITNHWWVSAFRGTSLGHLHSSYALSPNMTAVIGIRTILNSVAIASIFMVIVLIDSPLLQRSSSVVTATQVSHSTLSIPLSPKPFIQGATGIIPDHASDSQPNLYSPLFAKILQGYNSRNPINIHPAIDCQGSCATTVTAPGWKISCEESTTPYRLISEFEAEQLAADIDKGDKKAYTGPEPYQNMFIVNVVYNWTISSDKEVANHGGFNYYIDVDTTYKQTPGGNGTLGHTKCRLREAIVHYAVHFNDSRATLVPVHSLRNQPGHLVYRTYETQGMGDMPSTLGGFWLAMSNQFRTVANVTRVGGWADIQTSSPTSSMYLRARNSSALLTYDITWEDPTDDILAMAQELAFRTAVTTTSQIPGSPQLGGLYSGLAGQYNLTSAQPYILSPNLTDTPRVLRQDQTVQQTAVEPVYSTHRGFLAGGLAVIGLACLAILPLYWGFWTLGRPVSMSPLEIARAFEAPLMVHLDPNATGDELKKAVGGEKIRFRPVSEHEAARVPA